VSQQLEANALRFKVESAANTSPIPPLYLPYTSPISPLYLPYISPVVIKVLDESNGCGDAFLLHYDGAAAAGAAAGGAGACDGTVTSEAAVEAYLASQPRYRNTKALVLEWIRPAEDQEVHTLDILTVAQPDGSIELVTLLYWGDCANGRTSHSTRAGYVVDAISEEIVSTCKWYAPGFAGMRAEPGRAFGIGHTLPGVAAVTLTLTVTVTLTLTLTLTLTPTLTLTRRASLWWRRTARPCASSRGYG